MIRSFFLFLATLFILLAACQPCRAATDAITVCGTGDSQDLLRQMATAFMGKRPDITINVPDSIGSSGGVRKTVEGECDIGRIARPLKKQELQHNLTYALIARSPVVFFTSRKTAGISRIKGINSQQAVDIYSGTTTNWSQIGAGNAPIYVANREPGDSCRSVLEKHITDMDSIREWGGKIIMSTEEIVQVAASTPNTIGYGPLAMAQRDDLVILSFEGHEPTLENLRQNLYRLSVPLGLIWQEPLKASGRLFIDFIRSADGERITVNNGCLPATE
jgi:phosphate transport system substrate-binding protein